MRGFAGARKYVYAGCFERSTASKMAADGGFDRSRRPSGGNFAGNEDDNVGQHWAAMGKGVVDQEMVCVACCDGARARAHSCVSLPTYRIDAQERPTVSLRRLCSRAGPSG